MDTKVYKEEQHVYFNAELGAFVATVPEPIEFDQTYSQTIIKEPGKYAVTIANLQIPGSAIPLIIFTDSGDFKNTNKYSITLEYKAIVEQVFIGIDVGEGDPLFIYSINKIIEKFNNALAEAYEDIKTADPTVTGSMAEPPQLVYYPETGQLKTYIDANNFGAVDPVNIYFNTASMFLLGCLKFESTDLAAVDGKNGLLLIDDLGYNLIDWRFPGAVAAIATYEMPQTQGNAVESVAQLTEFLILSSSLGTRQELTNNFDISGGLITQTTIFATEPIIFDIPVNKTQAATLLTSNFVYIPSVYRWIDIYNSLPLSRVEFKIFYKFNNGAVYQLEIDPGKYIDIKFLFQSNLKMISHDNF